MSGVKQYNPNSRATEIIAALALREPLHSIERICDEQKQISTARLYAYATEAGDKLAGYACELRQAITSLRQDHAEAQRLLRENNALAQRCRELEACIAGDHTNLVALLRVGQAKAERERDALRAEVERYKAMSNNYCALGMDSQVEIAKLRAEVEKLQATVDRLEPAYHAWQEKTDWIQQSFSDGSLSSRYLGWHRADILNAEIERLQRELATAHADASRYASAAEDMRQHAAISRLKADFPTT